jgi:hypothetical protein
MYIYAEEKEVEGLNLYVRFVAEIFRMVNGENKHTISRSLRNEELYMYISSQQWNRKWVRLGV